MTQDRIVLDDRQSFRKWLTQNHQNNPGTWLVLGKGGKLKTLSASEALEEALCFGWIDGQLRSLGTDKYLKRFTPRRKGSVWSERNRKLALTLIEAGRMAPAGQAAIDRARASGTWDRPKGAPISEDQIAILTKALSGTGPALDNFLKMSPSVRRTYTAVYLSAKSEATRRNRLEKIVGRLKEHKKPM
jgi:uncharacterized protein YdeI (YjbR/CyaY-like superfamily)